MRTRILPSLTNILTVARREFVTRTTTRTFLISTMLLVVVSAAVALAPLAIGFFGREGSRVALYVGAADLHGDPVAVVDGLLKSARRSGPRVVVRRQPVDRPWGLATSGRGRDAHRRARSRARRGG